MASSVRRASIGLIDRLLREPHRFDFFQAVRILERMAGPGRGVGYDVPPDREAIRFRALPSLSFPAGNVGDMKSGDPPVMTTAFLGLIGPGGVLPHHYTHLVLERMRKRDLSLRDFLDVFHHRLLSLHYRAWKKYRLPIEIEHGMRESRSEPDPARTVVYSLAGMGTGGLRERLRSDPTAVLYFSGLFARRQRPAICLEGILEEYLQLPVTIEPLQGQWLRLAQEDKARLPGRGRRQANTNQPGSAMVIGNRVWDVQGKFRVRVGPVGYDQFRRFMPDGDGLSPLSELARLYVGAEFAFDVQPVLKAAEVPPTRLASSGTERSRLGWNTWVRSRPFVKDATQAIFPTN
jgi:type VI secretion system protein ImpH